MLLLSMSEIFAKVLRHSSLFERFVIPHGTIFNVQCPNWTSYSQNTLGMHLDFTVWGCTTVQSPP